MLSKEWEVTQVDTDLAQRIIVVKILLFRFITPYEPIIVQKFVNEEQSQLESRKFVIFTTLFKPKDPDYGENDSK